MLHIHVLFVAPLGTGHIAELFADQHEGRVAIQESPSRRLHPLAPLKRLFPLDLPFAAGKFEYHAEKILRMIATYGGLTVLWAAPYT